MSARVKQKPYQYVRRHSSSWKLAYADFVTAMMVTFIMLWLLNAVPPEKLSYISNYLEAGAPANKFHGARYAKKYAHIMEDDLKGADIQQPDQKATANYDVVNHYLQEGQGLVFKQEPEGLAIIMEDSPDFSVFMANSSVIGDKGIAMLDKVIDKIKSLPNYINITAYTAKDIAVDEKQIWMLSVNRCNSVRDFLLSRGVPSEQILSVTAFGDNYPIVPTNPYSIANNRIVITILKSDVSSPQEKGLEEIMG